MLARFIVRAIFAAIGLWLSSMLVAGVAFTGHTEYLAEVTGTPQVVMMLAGGDAPHLRRPALARVLHVVNVHARRAARATAIDDRAHRVPDDHQMILAGAHQSRIGSGRAI